MKTNRRHILTLFWSVFAAPVVVYIARLIPPIFAKALPANLIRPPGANPNDDKFLKLCIRCRACANVCEAGCIKFFTISQNVALAGTPYLRPRHRSCNLCMNCTQVCPTGALAPIKRDLKEIAASVNMGIAEVIQTNCLSYNGRVCGICRDACPLKSEAIMLIPKAKPVVIEQACIGCGRCEERCPQTPAAIVVRQPRLRA